MRIEDAVLIRCLVHVVSFTVSISVISLVLILQITVNCKYDSES